MNAFFLDSIFPDDVTDSTLKDKQIKAMAATMCNMLATKLGAEFPDRNFEVVVMEGDDFGVSFRQL